VPLVEDLGSGAMVDTSALAALEHEPTVAESLRAGSDLVCISGDKLFGGPQAGIIAGTAAWVQRVRHDPFFRVLRCDKLMLAALQETALAYLSVAGDDRPPVPVLNLLAEDVSVLQRRAESLAKALGANVVVGGGTSRCGGGTMPRSAVDSVTLQVTPPRGSVDDLARRLRLGVPPVIGFVAAGALHIDLRTVFSHQDATLEQALHDALA
jgi:L-seryl-tRNA(Ser) seleniumtransferase